MVIIREENNMTVVHLDTSRHMELFDPLTFNTPIHVIGVGATGSWLVLQLAKLGIRGELINVWDFDTVEAHNIPNQAFSFNDIGKMKVDALAELVEYQTGAVINTNPVKFEQQRISGYVYLMVDSMAERRRIWERAIKLKSAIKHMVEPRMGLHVGRVYNVDPMDVTAGMEYEKTYYSDEGAEVSACGNSLTVITSALGIASWCVRQLINLEAEVEVDSEILIDFAYNNILV